MYTVSSYKCRKKQNPNPNPNRIIWNRHWANLFQTNDQRIIIVLKHFCYEKLLDQKSLKLSKSSQFWYSDSIILPSNFADDTETFLPVESILDALCTLKLENYKTSY